MLAYPHILYVSALFLLEKANGGPPGTTLHIQSSRLRQMFAVEIVELNPPLTGIGELRGQVLLNIPSLDFNIRRDQNRKLAGASKELIVLVR